MYERGKYMSVSRDVISRAMNGNRNAITKIYNETYREVYSVIKPIIGDETVTTNLIRMTYVRAFKHMDHLKKPDNLTIWLKRVAKDTTKKWIEKYPDRYAELDAIIDEEGVSEDYSDKPSKSVLAAIMKKCAVDELEDDEPEEEKFSGITKMIKNLFRDDSDEKVGPVPKKLIPIIGAVIIIILVIVIVARALGGGSDSNKQSDMTETVVETQAQTTQRETERVLDTSAKDASDFYGSYKDDQDYTLELMESDEGFLMARIGSEADGYYDVYYYDYTIEDGKLTATCDTGDDQFLKFSDGSIEANITSNDYNSTYSPVSSNEGNSVTVEQADESSEEQQSDIQEESSVDEDAVEAQPLDEDNEE